MDPDHFYLGSDNAAWIGRTEVPLFVSRRRMPKVRLPRAVGPWVLDSGGFTELSMHGRWSIDAAQYAALVVRYREEVGNLAWVAPQDWMCEAAVLGQTGLTVQAHQERTVENFLDLRARLGPIVIPVLQGFEHDDYLRCEERYARVGVDLTKEAVVGLGSVCRRQDAEPAARIVSSLRHLRLHGFGVKLTGLRRFGHLLASADSMAWSFRGRRGGGIAGHAHKCSHCLEWALKWREQAIAAADSVQQTRLALA